MKKAIVLLLALAVLGGAAFAAPTISGRVQAWTTLDADGVTFAPSMRVNLNAKNDEGTVGIASRFDTTDVINGVTFIDNPDTVAVETQGVTKKQVFGVSYAYGYASFFDGMMKISAGKLSNFDVYLGSNLSNEQTGNISTSYYYGTSAVLAQLYPVDGLMIGAALKADGAVSLGDFDVMASYGIADTADIVFYGDMAEEFADSTIELGASISAVENLTAIIGYKGIASHGVFGIFGYAMDALYAEVGADLTFGDTLGYLIEGGVEYGLDVADIRLYGNYDGDAYLAGLEVTKGVWNLGFQLDDGAWSVPVLLRYAF